VDARGTGAKADYVPPNAPRWSANALARYTVPVGPGSLSLQLDGNGLAQLYPGNPRWWKAHVIHRF
jgi:hypothetical protein